MFGTLKHKALIWSAIISLSTLFYSCEDVPAETFELQGQTQGTTYSIIIVGDDVDLDQKEIDDLLHQFDLSLSTYDSTSVISKLNSSTDGLTINDPSGYFKDCYQESQELFKSTKGKFDPSVFPLVKGWGFMNDMETPLGQNEIDSILEFVDFESGNLHTIAFENSKIKLKKSNPSFKMDFNAIAQGLSVDVVFDYLEKKGFRNFFVEIGGELRVKGKNKNGTAWNIAIDRPIENQVTRELDTVVHISNKAIATSGNYRKFYVKNGVKYSHTLDPKTGKPVKHTLLSATVIADKCSTADGFATAFMVMGTDAALKFVEDNKSPKIEIYLLYTDSKGEIQHKMSPGFKSYLK